REEGEWIPNHHGGRENLEAIEFIRRVNDETRRAFPHRLMIAEESTSWGGVTRPTQEEGLGFSLKWDMGWMHDTLRYLGRDPIHRSYHHHELTFRQLYAYSERFALPLSHDEVVHGKRSLLERMPGDPWQQHANLRLLLAYQWAMPGRKMLFMGAEFGQQREWNHDRSLDWDLLEQERHAGLMRLVGDLNRLYRQRPELHARDDQMEGFRWVQADSAEVSVYALLRFDAQDRPLLAVLNMTPTPHEDYRVGVPLAGPWDELLNTDASVYGGSGLGNRGSLEALAEPADGLPCSLRLVLPPLGAVFLVPRMDPQG
ncbi:MAG: alpha amylase C-terminal domain-containing protein, partial [Myxococcales bacterium]|nr:alpha amylase C-terminal domain-containing protein [Myxococcales bacterium]